MNNAQYIDVVMPIYILVDFNILIIKKTLGGLWQYQKDGLSDNITESELFQYNIRRTGKAPDVVNT